MKSLQLDALPAPLQWTNPPDSSRVDGPDSLTIAAAGKTDWFADPMADTGLQDNAPAALFTPPDDAFQLAAKVRVDFASTFDAGVIQLRLKDDLWAKLCFEYSPQGQPMIVSVVTRGLSDDCNSTVIAGNEVYLRASVKEAGIAFHYSVDGRLWHLVRYFTLGANRGIRAGFSAQSPTGEGCTAAFSDISYQRGTVADFRSGE